MKIYTKTGDDGTTGLLGQHRVRKDDIRIEAYGEVDETNAALGFLLAQLPAGFHETSDFLTTIQNDLFVIGTLLATPSSQKKPIAFLDPARTQQLEQAIDAMEKELPPLKNFILPQGTFPCVGAHMTRAIARRAERRVVALSSLEPVEPQVLIYLNRLSDYLFVLARWLNHRENGSETPWINGAGSGIGVPGTDKLEATLHKLEDEKKKRQTLFERASSDLQRKKDMADKLFRKNVDDIKKDGGKIEKPFREMDLD